MATRSFAGIFGDGLHYRPLATSVHPVVHRRRVTALVLTVVTILFGIFLLYVYGKPVFAFYLPGLPMALILLWMSTDALRFDERYVEEPSRERVEEGTSA